MRFWTAVSILSTTLLVHCLKLIARRIRCKYAATISTYHFLATWCMLELAAFTNNIRRTSNVPIPSRIFLAFLVIISVFLQNASLQTNSLSFYQLSKSFVIAVILFHNIIVRHFRYKPIEFASILLTVFGVILMTITDLDYSIKGLFYSIFSTIATGYAQLLIEDFQRKYQMNGAELQLVVAPYQFIIEMIIATLFEATGEGSFMMYDFQLMDLILFLVTCFLAIWVNISSFMVIGYTSPLTFQMKNSLKAAVVLIVAMFMAPLGGDNLVQNVTTFIGAFFCFVGYFAYTTSAPKQIRGATAPDEIVPLLSERA